MTLQYEVRVVGLEINGHPHQELFTNFDTAAGLYETLKKKYKYKLVQLTQTERRILKESEPLQFVPPACPKGHKGTTDGKSVLSQGHNGFWYCGVCGSVWEEEGQ